VGITESKANGYIEINQEQCKGCQVCIAFCPKGAITLSDKLTANGYIPVSFNDGSECTGCAICAIVCPEVAIEVYRG
jgi:2-oxoglutarate ferredoxin oxidoreductase subunit delta